MYSHSTRRLSPARNTSALLRQRCPRTKIPSRGDVQGSRHQTADAVARHVTPTLGTRKLVPQTNAKGSRGRRNNITAAPCPPELPSAR